MKKYLYLVIFAFTLGITGCVTVDYIDWKPVYYIVNQTEETVCFSYSLQPGVMRKEYDETTTIEILANDTAMLHLTGRFETNEDYKPASVFSKMTFTSPSGEILYQTSHIDNNDWMPSGLRDGDPGAWMFARGWAYIFTW